MANVEFLNRAILSYKEQKKDELRKYRFAVGLIAFFAIGITVTLGLIYGVFIQTVDRPVLWTIIVLIIVSLTIRQAVIMIRRERWLYGYQISKIDYAIRQAEIDKQIADEHLQKTQI